MKREFALVRRCGARMLYTSFMEMHGDTRSDSQRLLSADHPHLTRLAHGFVVAALLMLAIVPTAIGWYIDQRRRDIRELTRPARSWVTEAHVAMNQAGMAVRGFVSSRDSVFVGGYLSARGREQRAYAQLQPLADSLGRRIRYEFSRLQRASAAWHREGDALFRMPTDRAAVAVDSLQEDAFLAAALLDEAITADVRRRDAEIDAAERVARVVTYGLVVIALIATVAVINLRRQLFRTAREVIRGRVEREQLLESKAQMVRGMAHDVKNPLGAIQGFALLLESEIKGPLNPDQKESARRIHQLVDSAVGTINTFLDLAKMEAGKLELHIEPVPIAELVRQIGEDYRAGFEAKGLDFKLLIGSSVPRIFTDPERVVQVLGNLLTNARKYTPAPGRVEMTVKSEPRPSESAEPGVGIHVTDSGPGIDPDQRDAAFTEFARLTNNSGNGGAGLGLAMGRRMARLLGGEIKLRSRVGVGSEFILWLPERGPHIAHAQP